MRKKAQGIVKSDKMDRTISVEVQRLQKHPRYGKYVRYSSTFMAHDPHNTADEGDRVEIEETRPISKNKSWRLVKIIEKTAETSSVEV